ncbi:MAG: adenosine kinase [Alphaproteobacteria bacterium]|nr:adenosine kinase [Alphaproteobacteria bacterium]
MESSRIDVLGIGNAIVDVLVRINDDFLTDRDLAKGSMQLIDADRALALYGAIGGATEVSGGSAANTVVGVSALGGAATYIGKVGDDELGRFFAKDLRAAGVAFHTRPTTDGAPTARSFVLVSPDAQRTMCTFLGASVGIEPDDVIEADVAAARVVYLEGYLWDAPRACATFARAAALARQHCRRVAFTLSDPFCVARHREDFLRLVREDVDILFANEAEITALYQVDDFDHALQRVRGHCDIAALTRSERGSVVLSRAEVHMIDAHPAGAVVDTTGAGDLYAGGFLAGLTAGRDLGTCGRLGSLAAGEVIGHLGARPAADLAALAAPLLRP